jgi:hypothetical protein
MTAQDLKQLFRSPFRPFRIELSTGQRVPISDPTKVWLGRDLCRIGFFKRDLLDYTVLVRFENVVRTLPGRAAAERRRRGRR